MLQITPSRLELESFQGAIATNTVLITNRSTTLVNITGMALAGETGVFTLTPPGLPLALAAATSVSVQVSYDPPDSALEAFVSNAFLVVVTDKGEITRSELLGRVKFSLATIAAAAPATITTEAIPNAVDAGITGDGSIVPDQLVINSIQGAAATGVLTFTNITATTFTITSIVLAGDTLLQLVSPPSLPATVPVNGQVSITVKYDPPDVPTLPSFLARAALSVTTSQGKLIRAAVIGRILQPQSDSKAIAGTEINPNSLALKSFQGVTTNGKFVIANTSSTSLVINKINLAGDVGNISLVSPPGVPLTIAANDTQEITVQYSPPNISNLPDFTSKAILALLTNQGRVIEAEIEGKLLTAAKLATGETIPTGGSATAVLPTPSAIEPPNPKSGDYWVDSSVTPNRTWQYNGFVWEGRTMTGLNANKFASVQSIRLDSPIATNGAAIAATVAPTLSTALGAAGSTIPVGLYQLAITHVVNGVECLPSFSNVSVIAAVASLTYSVTAVGPAGTTQRRFYRSNPNLLPLFLSTFFPGNVGISGFSDQMPISGLVSSIPNMVPVSGIYKYLITNVINGVEIDFATVMIFSPPAACLTLTVPLGPVGTTARNIYRTLPNGDVYYLAGVIPDNSTTTFVDALGTVTTGAIAPGVQYQRKPYSIWLPFEQVANASVIDGIKILEAKVRFQVLETFSLASSFAIALGFMPPYSFQNYLSFSEQFDNAIWIKTNLTVTPNLTIGNDGTLTMDRLVETAVNANHIVAQTVNLPANQAGIFSCYVRAGERTKLQLRIDDGGATNFCFAAFDLTLVTAATPVAGGTAVAGISGIQNLGNGLFRIWLSANINQVASARFSVYLADGAGAISYLGVITSGLFVWGSQYELGALSALPTTYLSNPLSTATVADAAGQNAAFTQIALANGVQQVKEQDLGLVNFFALGALNQMALRVIAPFPDFNIRGTVNVTYCHLKKPTLSVGV